jgi:hypothetical protein
LSLRSRLVLLLHTVLLRTSRTPLASLWALGYRAVAKAYAAYLTRGEGAAARYVRGSVGTDDFLAGVSDVDVAVVLPHDPACAGRARERATERWQRPRRALPVLDLVFDYPLVFEDRELGEAVGSSALTYGIDAAGEASASYYGRNAGSGRTRMLERPGLYGSTSDWRLLGGPERRPREPARDRQLERIAGWLELLYWWRWAFVVCADPSGPRTPSLCVKLVAEPARIWLWLAHGERRAARVDVLRTVARRLPAEAASMQRALALAKSLPESPDPPLAEALPVLLRLSQRIADLIGAELEPAGVTEVRLAGGDPPELILSTGRWRRARALADGEDPDLLPLTDWRSVVWSMVPDESFALLTGDPADPAALRAAAGSQEYGPYVALSTGGLMLFPSAILWRTRLRAVQCPATDPVSFALAQGSRVARFPNVRGWSAEDAARRAVAEHRAWLRAPAAGEDGLALAMLLTSARAALFLESVVDGDPELPLTVTESAGRLAERLPQARPIAEEAIERFREFAVRRTHPPARFLTAMRRLVLDLDAFREPSRLPAIKP